MDATFRACYTEYNQETSIFLYPIFIFHTYPDLENVYIKFNAIPEYCRLNRSKVYLKSNVKQLTYRQHGRLSHKCQPCHPPELQRDPSHLRQEPYGQPRLPFSSPCELEQSPHSTCLQSRWPCRGRTQSSQAEGNHFKWLVRAVCSVINFFFKNRSSGEHSFKKKQKKKHLS